MSPLLSKQLAVNQVLDFVSARADERAEVHVFLNISAFQHKSARNIDRCGAYGRVKTVCLDSAFKVRGQTVHVLLIEVNHPAFALELSGEPVQRVKIFRIAEVYKISL